MYSPKYAIETNRTIIDQVILDNPFATIVFQEEGIAQSLHLPLVLEKNKLIGHMAKANEAWKALNKNEALVIIHGPHCYISPTWYGTPDNVPTWNYISVQIRGRVSILEEETFLKNVLVSLSQKHDPDFPIEDNVTAHKDLLRGIVGIEISIDDVFAKFKLAQSRPVAERQSVIDHLQKSTNQNEVLMAQAMLKTLRS